MTFGSKRPAVDLALTVVACSKISYLETCTHLFAVLISLCTLSLFIQGKLKPVASIYYSRHHEICSMYALHGMHMLTTTPTLP